MPSTFILGGARSGKSRRALQLAESLNTQRVFVATAEPLDDEMKARILRHKSERSLEWDTIEAPLELVEALSHNDLSDKVCVVDCLTLWLSNLMHHDRDVDLETERLCAHLNEHTGSIILVSNEVGLGLVPETLLGRAFRDAQGRLNQRVADVCDTVEFVAAGLPIKLKG
jgi:adenosylcobinamide kinase/adenosylcobinamide-phosphate guanylyltransferase